MFVHNVSAVGEQYLDFEPRRRRGPVRRGRRPPARARRTRCRSTRRDLLVELDEFVALGRRGEPPGRRRASSATMFDDTGRAAPGPARQRRPRSSTRPSAHTDETIALLDNGLHGAAAPSRTTPSNIRPSPRASPAHRQRWRRSDQDLRQVLQGTPGHRARAPRAADRPRAHAAGAAQQRRERQPGRPSPTCAGLEQLLVTFPRVIATGFTGTTPDGYGHVNLQYNNDAPAVHGGLPAARASGGRPTTLRRADLPRAVQERAALRHAGQKYSPGTPAQPQPGPRRASVTTIR